MQAAINQLHPIKRVTLIDDDSFYIYALEKLMGILNIATSVTSFSCSISALDHLKIAKTHPELLPDVIFLDANMPQMDGWEFLDRFNEEKASINKKVRIYLMSASNSEADIQQATSKGVAGYLIKPITKEALFKIQEEMQEKQENYDINRPG